MAYVLTTTLIGVVTATQGDVTGLTVIQDIVVQLVMGAVMGFIFGKVIVSLMRKSKLSNESLYPIMVLTACIFIFSATYYLKGNTYLAVYIGGLVIGNSKFTRKKQTRNFFDGLTWLSQLIIFLVLGLMVKPHELFQTEVLLTGIIISLVMIFFSRPISVLLCMIPFKKYNGQDKLMLSWVGLKGAVPIIFAIMCKAHEVPHADLIFNVVFLCTLISLIVQGTSLSFMAKKLRLTKPPVVQKKLQYFDIDLPEEVESVATELVVNEKMLSKGNCLKDFTFVKKSLVIMVRRGEDFFVPTGTSELEVGDQLLLISNKAAEASELQVEQSVAEENDHWGMFLINHPLQFAKQKWQQLVHPKK
jgi:cell volume regulation protein A